jgi:hypothetical protein
MQEKLQRLLQMALKNKNADGHMCP